MNEAAIVAAWCLSMGGQAEVTLADNSRADCVTPTAVYEADYGAKWAEAIGQSLHYSHLTGKLPGILLIDASEAQAKRLDGALRYWGLPVEVWLYP